MTGFAGDLTIAARLARRELRGGVRGFRIFLACLALGVAAIASIGSDMQASHTTDTTTIDGATRQFSSSHSRPPSDAWITNSSSPGAQVIAELERFRTFQRMIAPTVHSPVALR